MTTSHVPVLAGELVDLLDPRPGEVAVDCTFGGGGHARLVAERIGPAGTLIAIDRDPVAEERFAELSAELPCDTRFIRASFLDGLRELRDEEVAADLVYMDLGMSSMQVDTRERGFSYAYDAPLDMRMDPDQDLTARELINTWDERRLARLFREFGEERYATQIARGIARERRRRALTTTTELVDVIVHAVPVPARFAGGHPAKRVFQAVRIAVNDELAGLESALPALRDALEPGGRLAVITYHSGEDRLVKLAFREWASACVCPPRQPVCTCRGRPLGRLTPRKPIVAGPDEVAANPRARSAHLRIFQAGDAS